LPKESEGKEVRIFLLT
jgi:hypothetical protein